MLTLSLRTFRACAAVTVTTASLFLPIDTSAQELSLPPEGGEVPAPKLVEMPNGNHIRAVSPDEIPEGLKLEPNALPKTEEEMAAPWIVFAESAPVYADHDADTVPVGEVAEGTQIHGTYAIDEYTDEEWIVVWDEVIGAPRYVSRTKVQRIHPSNQVYGDLDFGHEVVNRWWALPLDYEASDLVDIPKEWGSGRGTHQMRLEARDALVAMFEAARADGIEIRITSAYRSGETQKRIYTRRSARNRAQRSSAPPGHSEHQLGTTGDLVDAEATYVLTQRFQETPQSEWLEANAARFGFRRSYYPDNTHETGYISEPWHWRYIGKPQGKVEVEAASAPAADTN